MAETRNAVREYSAYISLGLSILAFATVYGEMRGTVNNHEKEIANIKADVRAIEREASDDKVSVTARLSSIDEKLNILLGDREIAEQERRLRTP